MRAMSDLERGVNALPRLHTAIALADGLGLEGEERRAFERHARPSEDDGEPAGEPLAVPLPGASAAHPRLVRGRWVARRCLLALVADRSNRVVSLIGPGGVGKTRLALEVAARLERSGRVRRARRPSTTRHCWRRRSATCSVSITVRRGPTCSRSSDHVGSHRSRSSSTTWSSSSNAAGDVATLVRSCPGVSIVTTSRVPLRITGEVRFAVGPLATSSDQLARTGRTCSSSSLVRRRRAPCDGSSGRTTSTTSPSCAPARRSAARHRAGGGACRDRGPGRGAPSSGPRPRPARERSQRRAHPATRACAPPSSGASGSCRRPPGRRSPRSACSPPGRRPTRRWPCGGCRATSTPAFFDLSRCWPKRTSSGVEADRLRCRRRGSSMFETTRQFARQQARGVRSWSSSPASRLTRVGRRSGGAGRARPRSVRTRRRGSTCSTGSCRTCAPSRVGWPSRGPTTPTIRACARGGRAAAVLGHPIAVERGRGVAERRAGPSGRYRGRRGRRRRRRSA